jgi:ferredoxin-NADP reductase
VFVDELRRFERQGVTIRLVIDAEDGRITDSMLRQSIGSTTAVYVCGPDGMSKGLTGSLRRLGVPAKNIITERFAF